MTWHRAFAPRYVQTLPHVRDTAVGINFQAAIATADPRDFLKERLLKPGRWDSDRRVLQALGLRCVYPLEGGRIVVALDVGEVAEDAALPREQPAHPAIIVNANFHRDCTQHPADEQVIQYLSQANDCWRKFLALLVDVLDVEWGTHADG